MTRFFRDAHECAAEVVAQLGPELRLGAPLGAGKANHLMNAIYRLVKTDPNLRLEIMTALTLERPRPKTDLEKRFLGPFIERVFGNYPDLEYELDRVAGRTPANVQIVEFYFPAGKFLKNARAQQSYISSNYTHVARDLLDRGVNVVFQQVSKKKIGDRIQYSLSCNADVTGDLMVKFSELKKLGRKCLMVAQVNEDLPFMWGDAVKTEADFDMIVDNPSESYSVFAPPKLSIGDAEFMIGLYGSTLIKDGGELQIGIGALGDSIGYNLLTRHQNNFEYLKILEGFDFDRKFGATHSQIGSLKPFEKGLFGATEMMVDGFIHLFNAGILTRQVYDDIHIQRLLNEGKISAKIEFKTIEELLKRGAIESLVSRHDFDYLQRWGILREELQFESGEIVHSDGSRCLPKLDDLNCRSFIADKCLGDTLKNGAVVHAGFFLGPRNFYNALKNIPEEKLKLFHMRSVSKINQLYGHDEIDRLHRTHARFVNTCLMMTLSGAAVSDGLESGAVVSGIGGQYNFVAMAHALPDGRSILNLRSTRGSGDSAQSSIVWNYVHISIPRHLRDIVITEYGIAQLRGKTDSEVIQALLNITDSRFQPALLAEAKKNQKIRSDYDIPEAFRSNTPSNYQLKLAEFRKQGFFPRFPFGSDFTSDETRIGGVLKKIKQKTSTRWGSLTAIGGALLKVRGSKEKSLAGQCDALLRRLSLDKPITLQEHLYRRLILAEFDD